MGTACRPVQMRSLNFWGDLKNPMRPTTMPMQPVAVSARSALRLQEGDEVGSLLVLLDAGEDHLRPRDVLLGVDQVLEHVLVRPHNPRVLVGLGVGEALAGAGGAAHDAPQGRALLRVAALLDGVALSALGLEELGPLLHITCWHFHVWLGNHHDWYCR